MNAGASFAIVLGAALFGYSSAQEQLAMAFAGALVGLIDCCLYRQSGRRAVKSGRLTLAGVALAAVLEGADQRHRPANPDVYDQLRFWQAGSLDIRNHTLKVVLIPVLIAGATALLLKPRAEQFKPRQRHRDGAGQSRGAHTVNWSAGDYRALWVVRR